MLPRKGDAYNRQEQYGGKNQMHQGRIKPATY
jgi:hypothetical protein